MNKRVFFVGKDYVTIADSRALLVFSDGLSFHADQKAQFVTP